MGGGGKGGEAEVIVIFLKFPLLFGDEAFNIRPLSVKCFSLSNILCGYVLIHTEIVKK